MHLNRPILCILLALSCWTAVAEAQSTDFGTLMQLGARARDAQDLPAAAAYFEQARVLDPQAESALLELAITREWQRRPQAARELYEQLLARDPKSRPALLGLGRVARAQYRLDEARDIYARLLEADPRDLDAQNGLAWVALANRNVAEAKRGFDGVLAAAPGNEEAKQGLRGVEETWPWQLDVAAGYVRTTGDHAWSAGALLRVDLDATQSVEVGGIHYTSELPTAGLTDQRLLPSNALHLGYFVRIPDRYDWAVVYDYREHSSLPTEHWLEARAGTYFGNGLQWFASARASFGASRWESQLYQTGLVVPLAGAWEIAPTVYYQHGNNDPATGGLEHRNLFAYGLDLNRQGPGRSFFNVGAGYSPDISNVDLHARLVWPLSPQGALLVGIQHVTINHETQASVGWRFYWR